MKVAEAELKDKIEKEVVAMAAQSEGGTSDLIRSHDARSRIIGVQIVLWSYPGRYHARIDAAGEVEFEFGEIELSQETNFIKAMWNLDGSNLSYFSLSGKAEDDTEFETEDLHFNSLWTGWNKIAGSRLKPVGGCLSAEFRRKLAVPTTKTTLRMHVKGFQNYGQLNSNCRLGVVAMVGKMTIDDPDTITGHITVQSDDEHLDLAVWHAEADRFLEHVRRVMSFASSSVLHGPIIELFSGEDLKVVTLSQTRQTSAPLRIFHHLNQQPVFDAAVNSYFSPPFEVKNLFFAIEWFAMEATYKEVGLVAAMTALENLVVSNLGDNDTLIQPEEEFKRSRRALRQVIKKCIEKWSTDESKTTKEIVHELDERLADLNRRSILQKLMTLAQRWSVPLEGIGEDKIKAAKKARDHIVHRGHYSNDGNEINDDLWEHVTVIREVVVRFVLTAIGYRGVYFSYIGGCHEAQFPPPKSDV